MMEMPEGMTFLGGRAPKEMYVVICKLGITAPTDEGAAMVVSLGQFIEQFLTELEVDQARAVAVAELDIEMAMGINFVDTLMNEAEESGQSPNHVRFINDGKRWF